MFSGIGLSEIMIVMLIALLVMGPEKLPDAARKLGKGLRELRRASDMFTDMFMLDEDTFTEKRSKANQQSSASAPSHGHARGESVARSPRKRVAARPVLLSNMRRPTHIESVALSPRLEATEHEALCVYEDLAAARGVRP